MSLNYFRYVHASIDLCKTGQESTGRWRGGAGVCSRGSLRADIAAVRIGGALQAAAPVAPVPALPLPCCPATVGAGRNHGMG